MVTLFNFWGTARLFFQSSSIILGFSPAMYEGSNVSKSFTYQFMLLPAIFTIAIIVSGCEVLAHCGFDAFPWWLIMLSIYLFLCFHSFLNTLQSTFCPHHSIEMALHKATNNIHITISKDHFSVLIFGFLSVAFDVSENLKHFIFFLLQDNISYLFDSSISGCSYLFPFPGLSSTPWLLNVRLSKAQF